MITCDIIFVFTCFVSLNILTELNMDPKDPRTRGPPGCFTFFIPKKLKLSYLRIELGAALPMDRSLVDLLGFAWAVALDLSLVDCIKVLKNVRVDLE